jgi:hypothetical protein
VEDVVEVLLEANKKLLYLYQEVSRLRAENVQLRQALDTLGLELTDCNAALDRDLQGQIVGEDAVEACSTACGKLLATVEYEEMMLLVEKATAKQCIRVQH